MMNSHRWRLSGALTSVACLAATLLASSAQASPALNPQPLPPGASTTVTAQALTGGGRKQAQMSIGVSGYWTAARMAHARSGDTLVPQLRRATSYRSVSPTGSPGVVAPTLPSRPVYKRTLALNSARVASRLMPLSVSASATVGRAFFHNPATGYDYSCSASALNSGSKELVLTAGHCVHGGQGGQWMTNWVFVPEYDYGYQPYGQFSAKYLTTFNAWISSSDHTRDVGMVTVWPNNNRALVNTVGGNGLAWNFSYDQAITILGYPAAAPYDGGWQQYCQGTTDRVGWWPFLQNRIEMQCGFTGGSSGSPWLMQYNNSTGLGYANGAMSTLSSGGWNAASYFDDGVHNMFTLVANRT
jgi:V8-like Glu-specific endopeptidase